MANNKDVIEEGEISDCEEISASDFTAKVPEKVVVGVDQSKQQKVWTMEDLMKYQNKYQMARNYAPGLYNFAWAQAVQNKPLDNYKTTNNNNNNTKLSINNNSNETSSDKSVVVVKEEVNNNNVNDVVVVVDDDNKIVLDDSDKEEGEIEEGEIDLDTDVSAVVTDVAENANVVDMEIDEDEEEEDDGDVNKKWINVIKVGLKGIVETVNDGKESFEDVCSRLEDLLDTLSTLLSDNEDLSKDDLVQLAFFSIRTVNSVFTSMGQNEKELNRQTLSRMLTNVKSYTPVVFTPEQLKEVETMLVSCNKVVVGSSTMENDKDVDTLVAPSAENAKQEVSSVSEESDLLDAMPIRTSNTTPPPNPAAVGYPVRTSYTAPPPNPAAVGYPVRTSNQNMKQSDSLKTQTSMSKNRISLPLIDLHKDHDMDSLPSPTRENTNPLPLGKALFEGDAAFRPEWPAPRAVVQRYDTDALKAVSTYQQKFSRSSFFSNDLPSPTPSEDSGGDAGGDFGGEVSSFSTVSKPNFVTQTTTVQSKNFSNPHVERPSVQLHANARNAAPVYSTSSSVTRVANKTRDPRLRLANPESSSDSNQGMVPLPRKQPAIEPLGLVQGSRKQKIVDEPVLVDGPALKRQKNEFGDSSNSRNIMSVSQARGFENGVTTSSLPSTSAGNMPIPVTGVSTSSASLQSILKDIAVNPSQWMNLINMEQQKSVDPAKYVTQSVSQSSFQTPVQITTVASQPMVTGPRSMPMATVTSQPLATGPWPTPMTSVTSQPLVTGPWSTPMTTAASQPLATGPRSTAETQIPQTASGDDSGKVRMKPRDPRRALQSKSLQKSEPVISSAAVEGTKGNSKQADPRVSSKQADPRVSSKQADPRVSSKQADPRVSSKQADPRASFQTSSTPDITRQFTKNLKNIADLVTTTVSAPVQISQPAPVQISQPAQVHSSFVNMKGLPSQPVRLQNGTGQTSEEAASKPQNAWGDVEHLFGRYDDQERAAIQRERSKRMEEQKKMFAERKLCLVLDLDHTLLNSAKFSEIEPMHDELLRKKEEQDRDKQHRHLFRFPHMSMWTKLRPGIWKFLEKASQLYELHLYTMGNKLYATEMAKVLDPKGVLFNGRVISRGDDGDNVDGDPKSKDLEGVLGMESAVVIIDDSIRVWPHNKLNLIVVERYIYFPCSRRQFGLPGPSLLEIDHDERPDEGTLASSLAVIEKIHQNFFMEKSLDDADVRNILASEQRKILGGCRIVFSRVFPVGESSPHMHPLWQTAEQFGAVCTNQLDEQVTHVVANSLGTDKVNWALATGRPVVHPGWVEASALLYRRANEQDFAVKP